MDSSIACTSTTMDLRKYLSYRLEQLSTFKGSDLVATEAGISFGLLTRFTDGTARVPLHMVGPLATALEVEGAFLFRLAMEQFQSREQTEEVFDGSGLTNNEARLVAVLRSASNNSDPDIATEIEDCLREALCKRE